MKGHIFIVNNISFSVMFFTTELTLVNNTIFFSVSQKEQSSGNQEYVLSVTLMWKTEESGSGISVQHQTEPFYFGCECKSTVVRFHLGGSSDSSRPLD